jgi:hypothetical protein
MVAGGMIINENFGKNKYQMVLNCCGVSIHQTCSAVE